MNIVTLRPKGYDEGAFTVEVNLEPSEWDKCRGWPIVFKIPSLAKRALYPDEHYRVAIPHASKEIEIGGVLRDGCWRGHCYSNGVEESKNPTPITEVEAALQKNIGDAVQCAQSVFTP